MVRTAIGTYATALTKDTATLNRTGQEPMLLICCENRIIAVFKKLTTQKTPIPPSGLILYRVFLHLQQIHHVTQEGKNRRR